MSSSDRFLLQPTRENTPNILKQMDTRIPAKTIRAPKKKSCIFSVSIRMPNTEEGFWATPHPIAHLQLLLRPWKRFLSEKHVQWRNRFHSGDNDKSSFGCGSKFFTRRMSNAGASPRFPFTRATHLGLTLFLTHHFRINGSPPFGHRGALPGCARKRRPLRAGTGPPPGRRCRSGACACEATQERIGKPKRATRAPRSGMIRFPPNFGGLDWWVGGKRSKLSDPFRPRPCLSSGPLDAISALPLHFFACIDPHGLLLQRTCCVTQRSSSN